MLILESFNDLCIHLKWLSMLPFARNYLPSPVYWSVFSYLTSTEFNPIRILPRYLVREIRILRLLYSRKVTIMFAIMKRIQARIHLVVLHKFYEQLCIVQPMIQWSGDLDVSITSIWIMTWAVAKMLVCLLCPNSETLAHFIEVQRYDSVFWICPYLGPQLQSRSFQKLIPCIPFPESYHRTHTHMSKWTNQQTSIAYSSLLKVITQWLKIFFLQRCLHIWKIMLFITVTYCF